VPRLALLTVAAVLAVAPPALGATAKGVYHGPGPGLEKNQCTGNEGEGFFRLKKTDAGKLKLVKPGSFTFCGGPATWTTITAPSNFKCNQYNANLPVKSVPVKDEAFDWSGKAPIGPNGADRHLRFKGHWVEKNKVKGYTRIRGGGCDSGKLHWTMRRVAG